MTVQDMITREKLSGARDINYGPNGEPVGYWTWFGGLYVCLTCGHLCECGDDNE